MLRFGAHVMGLDPISDAEDLGADIAQIIISDPQSWKKPVLDYPDGASGLKAASETSAIGIFVHSPYVINVASTNNRIRIPSRKLLQQTVSEAAALGALGVVVHGGHVTGGDDPVVGHDNWRKAVDGLSLEVPILIENTAGGNKAMARTLDAIGRTWDAISGSPNADSVGFCLDTCHAWASGLDLETVVADVLAVTGRIDLVHLNNSRDLPGSGADRHAPLQSGQIDPELLLHVAREAGTSIILETPSGPDEQRDEIAWLRSSLIG